MVVVVKSGGLEGIDSGADLGGFLPYGSGGHVAGADKGRRGFSGEKLGEVEAGGGSSEVEDGGVVGSCGGDRG